MKRILGATMVGLMFANQAQALSCLRPDVARTFTWAAEGEAAYVVLLGRFEFDAAAFAPSLVAPKPDEIPAMFEGQYLGTEGFVDAPPLNLTLDIQCVGPWCGGLDPTAPFTLAFVRQTQAGYILTVGACNDTAFQNPSDEDIARVEECMTGGQCDELSQ